MPITIETLASGPIGWKMASFPDWNPYKATMEADDTADWSGLSIATKPNVAEGYAADYLDGKSGDGTAYLHQVHLLKPIQVVKCTDALMGSGNIEEAIKTAHIRAGLPEDIKSRLRTGPLLPSLGRLGMALKCLHDDEGNVELIIPNKLSALVLLSGTRTLTYRSWQKTH